MNSDSKSNVLLTTDAIQEKVREIGSQISRDYADKQIVLVGVLNGALIFLADLMRSIHLPLEAYTITASSYDGYESVGKVEIVKALDAKITGRHVIIVEDIVDTGITLERLLNHLRSQNPASLEVCSLLDKQSRRKVKVPIKYVGFRIPDEFVIGYGLDYNQRYRNLPYIASINDVDISKID